MLDGDPNRVRVPPNSGHLGVVVVALEAGNCGLADAHSFGNVLLSQTEFTASPQQFGMQLLVGSGQRKGTPA